MQLLSKMLPANLLRIADIMSSQPVTVGAETPIRIARDIAQQQHVQYLLVWLPGGVLGATCMQHLSSASGEHVSECICEPVWIGPLNPSLRLFDVAEIMGERAFRCLPVMENGRLCGVVTGGDLRRAGLPAEVATPSCACCGCRYHVRYDPRGGDVPICLDCLDRSLTPSPLDELGVGD